MIKNSIGNLDVEYNLIDILDEMGIKVLNFNAPSAILLGSLPFHHKDPFDRMIISQAINEKYKIISVDTKFTFYDCDLL